MPLMLNHSLPQRLQTVQQLMEFNEIYVTKEFLGNGNYYSSLVVFYVTFYRMTPC